MKFSPTELLISFINPKEDFLYKIKDFVRINGFELVHENGDNWIYMRNNEKLGIGLCEDRMGKYIVIICTNIFFMKLHELLKECPVCGSKKIKPSILSNWENELTDRLYREGKLQYWAGHYTRGVVGAPTRICLECGLKWHNEADIVYWVNTFRKKRELNEEDLGIT